MAEPSPSARRARTLLAGGAVGGIVTMVATVLGFWVGRGAAAALSAAFFGLLTIAFFTIGQAIQVLVADAAPGTVMFAALASYGVRVTALGLLLMVSLGDAGLFGWLDPAAVVVTTVTVVLGWLVVEVWVFTRLRIPTYDEPEVDSSNQG